MDGYTRNGSYVFGNSHKNEEKKAASKFFAVSFVLHLLFFAIFGSGLRFGVDRTIKFTTVQARLVRFGEERDKRLLPRITKPKPRPQTEKKSAKSPLEKNRVEPEKQKSLKKAKGNSLKPQEKAEIVKKEVSLSNLLADEMEEIKKDARAEESKEGSKEGVEDGDVIDPALALKANLYTRKVGEIIRKHWTIPSVISNEKLESLETKIFFRINFLGEIYGIKIVSESGNRQFDSSVIEAVKKTATLPLPGDKNLKKLVLQEGFECPFTPN